MSASATVYLPPQFDHQDPVHLAAIMARHNFAVMYSCDGEGPMVTHLPVLATRLADGQWQIEAHCARMNPHWRRLAGVDALLVFSGPHTYVSPTQYKSQRRVPTWNYIAVHALGRVTVLDAPEEKEAILKRLIAHQDPQFDLRWQEFEPEVRAPLLQGIVGLRMQVTHLEGKFKLNQHRLADDRDGLAEEYANADENRRELGAWMERLGLWTRKPL